MKRILFTVIVSIAVLASSAQDIHFSQYTQSPLTLNPALTGLTPCTYRMALNYRNQWASAVGPASYQTFSGSFDAGLWREKLNDNIFGVGGMAYNDVSGDGSLTNLTIMGSLAYHQKLGNSGTYLSLGGQIGLVQKRVDYNKLIFESQIGANGVDPTLPSGEYGDDNFSYLDYNAGINFRSRVSDKFALQFGGAYFHLSEPVETFYNYNVNRLNAHYIGYGSFKFGVGKSTVVIPSFLYMQQTEGSNVQMNSGIDVGFQLEKGVSMAYTGLHYRTVDNLDVADAVIVNLGLDYNNINFGLSYDINISGLSTVTDYRGGIELSFIYWGCIDTNPKSKPIDCPRF
ncbi:MAG: PorP/SprF family type IX secretion system membrane protein [Chitinophagales bacterium]